MTRTSGALGGPPLRRNPFMIAALGDSRIAALYVDSANGRSLGAMSPLNWANALLGQRFVIGRTWGVSGDRTDQIAARADAAIATGAGILYLQGGANDLGQGYEGTAAAANLIAISERARRAGMTVVIEVEVGSGNFTTAATLGRMADLNRMLRDYADVTSGVYLHDTRAVVLDPAIGPTAVAYRTGYAYDATHANGRGAYYWGKSLAVLLSSLVPPRASPLLACRADGDAANGRRQLAINPLFVTATGGTLSNGITGVGPSRWGAGFGAVGPSGSIAMEASSIGNSAVFDVTFTAADQIAFLAQNSGGIDLANWQAGDVVQLVADVEIVTPGVLAGLFAMLEVQVGGVTAASFSMFSASGSTLYRAPDEACRFTLMTRPYTVPGGTKNYMTPYIRAVSNAAGAAKWKVHQLAVIRRADGGY